MCMCVFVLMCVFPLPNIVHLCKKDFFKEKKKWHCDAGLYVAHSDTQIHYKSHKISKGCLCITIVQSGFHVNALNQLMKLILRES